MIQQTTLKDDTGQVVSDSKKIFKIYDEERGYLFRSKNFFVKSFGDFKLSSFIANKSDYRNMHILAEEIYKDTNMIAVRMNGKARPAGMEDMAWILGLKTRSTKEFIERMMDKGLIAKAVVDTQEKKEVQYYLNPLFFMSNKYLNAFLYMMFREQLKPFLKPWVLRILNDAANLKELTAEVKKPKKEVVVENPVKEKIAEIIKEGL